MNKILEVKVNQELVNYIESLDYEQAANKDVITFMIEKNMNIESDTFKNYQKSYTEHFKSFEIAKKELEDKYMPEEWKGHQINWTLDYYTGIITFEKICEC